MDNNYSLIIGAAQFAAAAHCGVKRKYTEQPYIIHPMRVAGMMSLQLGVTEEEVAAAWLHDIIEDCGKTTVRMFRHQFPAGVISLVDEVTNPSKNRPDLRRADRKLLDRQHVAKASRWGKILKLLDRIDNITDMHAERGGFKVLYADETRLLVSEAIRPNNQDATIDQLSRQLLFETERLISQNPERKEV